MMSCKSTAKDFENLSIEKMGAELGRIFYKINEEVALAHIHWHEFRALFNGGKEQISLLNRSAGPFFKMVQNIIFDDVVMRVMRITDGVGTDEKPNLTVKLLPGLIIGNEELKEKIMELVKITSQNAHNASAHRNNRLAHHGLEYAKGLKPLGEIHVRHVEGMLKSLNKLMNEISVHFLATALFYDEPINYAGAGRLVSILKQAEKYNK